MHQPTWHAPHIQHIFVYRGIGVIGTYKCKQCIYANIHTSVCSMYPAVCGHTYGRICWNLHAKHERHAKFAKLLYHCREPKMYNYYVKCGLIPIIHMNIPVHKQVLISGRRLKNDRHLNFKRTWPLNILLICEISKRNLKIRIIKSRH